MKAKGRRSMAVLQALRWLSIPTPPGDIETLEAVIGRDSEGRACEMRPTADGVMVVTVESGQEERVDSEEVGRRLIDGRFVPTRVRVHRDVTEKLFKLAVMAAQAATVSEGKAYAILSSDALEGDDDDGINWALFELIGHIGDTVPGALQAIVFAVATAEAQVNAWGRWTGDDDRQPVEEKSKRLARDRGGKLELGKGPGKWFMEAVKARHYTVHARPGSDERPITRVDAKGQAARARHACLGVRSVLVDLARLMNEPPPRYLAMCPHDADEVGLWLTAIVMTGVRDDPVFESLSATQAKPTKVDPASGEAAIP